MGNPGTLQTAAHILRKEPESKKRNTSVGTYFRLVKEQDGESKRQRFEASLARLKAGEADPLIFRYHQKDFDAIPGSPWVYWINSSMAY